MTASIQDPGSAGGSESRAAWWGFGALACAAAALVSACVYIFAGPFGPVSPVGVSLGEIAGDTIKSTVREVLGRPQPAPAPPSWTLDDTLNAAVVVLSVLSIVLAALSFALEKMHVPARFAVVMGGSALLMLWLSWVALVICGVLLVTAVASPISEGIGGLLDGIGAFFKAIGEFFSGIFGG